MADITTTAPIPTGPMIPQEYQDLIDQARRRQQIAQMLEAKSLNPQAPQQIGPVAAKMSPLAGFANVAQAGLGAYADANAQQDASDAKQQFQTDQNTEIAKMLALPEAQRPNAMMGSKFPLVQQWGQTAQTQQNKNHDIISKELAASFGPQIASQYLQNPEAGVPPLPTPVPDRMAYVKDANSPNSPPVPMIISTDPKTGKETYKAAEGMQFNMGPTEAQSRRTADQTMIGEQRPKALSAQETIANNNQIIEALQQGAQAGTAADWKQNARKVLTNVFGVSPEDLPETGPTENAINIIMGNLGAKAKTFGGNPSNIEDKYSREIVGSILTDPTALPTILGRQSGEAMKIMQDYHGIIAAKQKQDVGKNYADLYEPALQGTNIPDLTGPPVYTLSAIKQMKNLGGDISQFGMSQPNMGPGQTGSSIQPFASDSKFSIVPTAIKPSVGPAAAAAVAPPVANRPTATGPNGEKLILSDDGKSWVPR